MTPYIVVTLAVVGMISFVPLVLYWERKDEESDKKNREKKTVNRVEPTDRV